MITGEERIRELLGELYSNVTGYDGRPTDYQVSRTESLGHELQDAIDDFQKLTQKDLPGINSRLTKKKMETIVVLSETDWRKKTASGEGAGSAALQESDDTLGEQIRQIQECSADELFPRGLNTPPLQVVVPRCQVGTAAALYGRSCRDRVMFRLRQCGRRVCNQYDQRSELPSSLMHVWAPPYLLV